MWLPHRCAANFTKFLGWDLHRFSMFSQVTIVMPPREAEDLRQELVSGQGTGWLFTWLGEG